VESQAEQGGVRITGSHPVASVISMGKRLAVVRMLFGWTIFCDSIRAGENAARLS
jgi:hypothetical protein